MKMKNTILYFKGRTFAERKVLFAKFFKMCDTQKFILSLFL